MIKTPPQPSELKQEVPKKVPEVDDHHVHSVWLYVAVWGALTVLTFITWAIAQVDLGPFNTPIALGIALLKAGLVVWFFMDLRHQHPLNKLYAVAGVFFLLILIGLTLADYLTRSWLPSGRMW